MANTLRSSAVDSGIETTVWDVEKPSIAARVTRYSRLLTQFHKLKVLVLGDPILDGFVSGAPTRLCREQPVPVVLRSAEENRPGGAANTAANLAALGAHVVLLGVVGIDSAGEAVCRCLAEAGVDPGGLVVDQSRPTAYKCRILAGEHYVARVDSEPSAVLPPAVEQQLLERLDAELGSVDVVIVSDYGLGSVSHASMLLVSRAARRQGLPVVLDAKDLLRHASATVTVATPNWHEAAAAAGVPASAQPPSAADREALARELLRHVDADNVVVTRGSDGVLLVGRARSPEELRVHPVHARNAVGAGDSLAAGMALGLAAGAPLRDSVRLGMELAAVAVTKPLTATVTLAELSERLEVWSWDGPPVPASLSAEVEGLLSEAHALDRRIVFTNGVFDLLHEGHVSLLQRARQLGDLLVVAINSDESVRCLKGEGRPINDVEERRALLEALDCVDLVLVFDGPNACNELAAVRPALFVKGDDHDIERVPERTVAREIGSRLVSIPHLHAVSTSLIINRVLSAARRAG
jgi:D-beta-D-heptose 7-phosphate kinase / D-beta-D-heptose 1-phosphate adenosyltransferase